MISVICWKWRPMAGYRSKFEAEHVNTLRKMVARNYKKPHQFICVTDDPAGIDADIKIVPLWDDYANVPSPHGGRNPSCYRRLKAFSVEAKEIFGPRFVSIDLDCVIVGDVAPLWDRQEQFVIWGDTAIGTPYNGSMFLLSAGARRRVWDEFDPKSSPARGLALKYMGSDQAWIAACLGPREMKWRRADGVYSYRNDLRRRGLNPHALPAGARVVFFHGAVDPWHPEAQRLPWVREHYR